MKKLYNLLNKDIFLIHIYVKEKSKMKKLYNLLNKEITFWILTFILLAELIFLIGKNLF